MMYSIKHFILFFILLFTLLGCDKPKANLDCGYTRVFGFHGHILEFPIEIIPNQLEYQVGDTIQIDMVFPDSIYDVNIDETFKIEDWPFRPGTFVYRVDEDLEDWSSGLLINNEVIVDTTIYEFTYDHGGILPKTLVPRMLYEDGIYHFSFKIVCNTPGRYVMLTYDNNDAGNGGSFDEEDIIVSQDFEGKCYTQSEIANIIKGENHFDEFIDELIAIDETFNNGKYISIDQDNYEIFGSGGIAFEFSGIYGFEVVE